MIATGGLSIPKMGATGFGYRVARQFGLEVLPTSAGLVPFTFADADPRNFKDLAGVAFDAEVSCNGVSFSEALLFTHRGLSGPAILQISSFWQDGMPVEIDLLPGRRRRSRLRRLVAERPKAEVKTLLSDLLPRRLALQVTAGRLRRPSGRPGAGAGMAIADRRPAPLGDFARPGPKATAPPKSPLAASIPPTLSSKTMEARAVPGLYFIGEVVDVTGWLGGYNFQWAWSSGHCAGQFA